MENLTTDPELSERSKNIHHWEDFLNKYMSICNADEYNPDDNPQGYVNLGTAVNNISNDIVYPKLMSKDVWHCNTELLQYRESYGIHRLRKALAVLMSDMLETFKPVNLTDIFCFVGVTACIDVLSHCLADPGDVFLVPTPIYGRVYTDITQRSHVDMWPIPIISSNCEELYPELTIEKVKKAYDDAIANNKNVRALFLINPNNPLGDIYDPKLLMDMLIFCHEKKLHVIVDEVYAKSVFPGRTKFHSVLKFPQIPDPLRTHVLYGISKDFAVAGLRIGLIHTRQKLLQNCLTQLSFYQNIPFPVMEIASRFIEDMDWCRNFALINQQRIGDKFNHCKTRLKEMGLNVRDSVAGFFLWVDFRPVCGSESFAQEFDFFRYLMDHPRLYVVPGKEFFCAQPGWFRLTFTGKPDHVDEGLNRLEKAIKSYKQCIGTVDTPFDMICGTDDPKSESIESLVGLLKSQIKSSNWLSENTAETWTKENPSLAELFSAKK